MAQAEAKTAAALAGQAASTAQHAMSSHAVQFVFVPPMARFNASDPKQNAADWAPGFEAYKRSGCLPQEHTPDMAVALSTRPS